MKPLERALPFLLLALVFAMPWQWGFPFPPAGKPFLFVSCADAILGIAFLFWFTLLVARRGWREARLPHPSFLVFAGLAVASCFFAAERKLAFKEAIQTLGLFVAGGLLFANGFRSPAEWQRAIRVLGIATALVLLLALAQYFNQPNGFLVRGSLTDKNALAAYLALVLPFLLGAAFGETNPMMRWTLALLAVPGLLLTLSAGALIALLSGLLLAVGIRSRRALAVSCALLALAFALGPRLYPRTGHGELLQSSIGFYLRSNFYFTPQGASGQAAIILEEAGSNAARDFLAVYEQAYPDHPGLEAGRRLLQSRLDESNKGLPKEEQNTLDLTTLPKPVANSRYIRWHAAWKMIRQNRAQGLVGVGAGNFQKTVNQHYDPGGPLRKPDPVNRGSAADTFAITSNEPNSFNQYLVITAELGFLGLFAFLWLLVGGLCNGIEALKGTQPVLRGIGLGALAALVSALGVSLFHPLVVRGLGLALVFILCAAHNAASAAESPQSKN